MPPRLCNSIINKTPIDAATNRKIGGSAPSTYLRRLKNDITEDDLNDVLYSHWISPDLLAADRFADCFVERGEAMLALIGKAMGKPTPTGREISGAPLAPPEWHRRSTNTTKAAMSTMW